MEDLQKISRGNRKVKKIPIYLKVNPTLIDALNRRAEETKRHKIYIIEAALSAYLGEKTA